MRADLQNGKFDVVDDPSTATASAVIKKVQAAIAKKPGITQQELIKRSGLPETNGRNILQREEGHSWFVKRGKKKTFHY